MPAMEQTIFLLGSTGVGKSALAVRMTNGNFLDKNDPTFLEFFERTFEIDSTACRITIWDTAGREEWREIEDMILRASGIMLIYSIAYRRSFECISKLHDSVVQVKNDSTVILKIA
mmetsp:Transcript_3759/g.5245  ORF Transcript_3759/g.5245 Transcript_3759/m.5245 type:complete len:116 (+) Transcript_3759:240-587(+)